MTEFDLLEICRRFRLMEDAAETLDLFVAAQRETMLREMEPLEDIDDARADMDACLEACREDMVRMQEELRK